ncbi:MAG TPA: primosomal protein N' [Lentisphaeria bacterium]|nr:MAG: primosomal protein N' [Lentisphaerae bacterium GWF2_50_93]HCE44788.1 primosomal protein N' [Lentisphaeria bacterium]
MKIARIILGLSLDKPFDYLIPVELESQVHPGIQVYIPFGKSQRRGYVVAVNNESSYPVDKLKKIDSVCEVHPKIPSNLLRLGKWISEYYCCSQEQAVRALLPSAVRSGKIKRKTIKLYYLVSPEDAQKYIFDKSRKSPARIKIIQLLLQHPGTSSEFIKRESGAGKSVIKSMIKDKILIEENKDVYRNPFANVEYVKSTPPELTGEQKTAVDKISEMMGSPAPKPHTLLLYGVTGSGKTEVYLRAIATAIQQGKDSIVLVPEISLTPQTTERFRSRFGDMVSVLHSSLSDGERFDEWTKIHRGQVRIVVGARSALFAPFKNLGLIIVDEEHENSYKQDESPRYHARDVAVMRGYMEKAIVILGSATPSFESYHNAMTGKYAMIQLSKRVDGCVMPKIKIVDMHNEISRVGGKIFSTELVEEIRRRLEKSEQTIIFLNRKGFATRMVCNKCGYIAMCPDCSITYTYSRKRDSLACHFCGSIIPAHKSCPKCNDAGIRYSGTGTEKIDSIAAELFPKARIARMDSDTMTHKDSYEKVLSEFRRGKIDMLIGTQMIAKGLDFPNVTLVGIINADLSLYLPDFRAEERTFQLLTQVAGRSGRGDIPGEVLIQSFTSQNTAIQCSKNNDYLTFYNEQVSARKKLNYPPFSHLIAVHFRGPDEKEIAKFADEFLEKLRPHLSKEIRVAGPQPSPVTKIKTKYRYMIIFRGDRMKEFREALREQVLHSKRIKDLDCYVDVDAVNMM